MTFPNKKPIVVWYIRESQVKQHKTNLTWIIPFLFFSWIWHFF